MKRWLKSMVFLTLLGCGGVAITPYIEEPSYQLIKNRGTNYALYDYGPSQIVELDEPPGWRHPAMNMRLSVGFAHLEKERVLNQLKTLRNSGINVLVFPIWTWEINDSPSDPRFDGIEDGVNGEILDHNGGVLMPQHRENLEWLSTEAVNLGFDRLIVRFNYNNNVQWNYTETNYQEVLNYQEDVRTAVRKGWLAAKGFEATNEILFDLGGEILHPDIVNNPSSLQYLQRRWKEWLDLGRLNETVGYSAIHYKDRIKTLSDKVYGPSGVYPNWIAITTYPKPGGSEYSNIYDSLKDAVKYIPKPHQKIMVLEAYWNDKQQIQSLLRFANEYPQYIPDYWITWPYTTKSTFPHFHTSVFVNMDCVDKNYVNNSVLPIVCE